MGVVVDFGMRANGRCWDAPGENCPAKRAVDAFRGRRPAATGALNAIRRRRRSWR